MKRIATSLAALSLSACALGPDYVRPPMETPAAYRWQAAAEAPGSAADLAWWELYRDPALSALIARAAQQNLDVRIAAARVEQARAAAGASGLVLVPKIGLEASGLREKRSTDQISAGADRLHSDHEAGIGLSWELDLWGRLRRLNEAARARLLAAEADRQGVMVSLVADVATRYLQLASLDEQLRIAQGTVETREQFLKLTQAQFDRGVGSGLDVSTAEAQLATARASVPDFERQIAQAENALSLLLGTNPGEIPRSAAGTAEGTAFPQVPAGLPSALLDRRPDLRRAEQDLVAANARVGAAKASLFPTLSLTGSFGTRSNELSNLFSAPAETWSIGVGLLQPILDADRNLYAVDLADAAKRETLLAYEKSVRNAFREVSDALVAQEKFRESEQAQRALVDALGRADEIAIARYRVGYSSYFDVINADRDLFNAKLSLSSARLNAQLATVQLYRALGGGWQTREDAPPAPNQ
jgi:multidrug efflux system outer membrane protein